MHASDPDAGALGALLQIPAALYVATNLGSGCTARRVPRRAEDAAASRTLDHLGPVSITKRSREGLWSRRCAGLQVSHVNACQCCIMLHPAQTLNCMGRG